VKIAIVHDWLVGMRGGEKCLEVLCAMYPKADIFTLIHNRNEISATINRHKVIPSKLQSLPGVNKFYRYLLPVMPAVAREISRKLGDYDLVISISHCFAKNIQVPEGVPHICYCLSPMRYIWDQYDSYFKGRRIEPLVRPVASMLRNWDRGVNGITRLVGISEFVRERIKNCYGVDAEVIYPPVDCASFGSEELKKTSKGEDFNVTFKSFVAEEELRRLYRTSRAMVFAAEEDFGITPVENQAAGRPVIALGKGGALETIVEGKSGIFFDAPSVESVKAAVLQFVERENEFHEEDCISNAIKFSVPRFEKSFSELVDQVAKSSATNDRMAKKLA